MSASGQGSSPGTIRPLVTPGLPSFVDRGGLTLHRAAIAAHPTDGDALRLVEWAQARAARIALVPPDPLGILAALVPAAVHVADMVDAATRLGIRSGSSRRVVVVTRDARLRGVYRNLGIAQPAGGSVLLRDVVPAATRSRHGAIRTLDVRDHGWSTLFVSAVREVDRVRGVDLVVVDLPVDDAAAVLDLRQPTVIVARDPCDPILRTLAAANSVYAWAPDDLADLGDGLSPRLKRLARGVEVVVVPVTGQRIASDAALFWNDAGALVRAGRRSSFASDLVRLAFGLFYDLVGLAMPTEVYESAFGSIGRRLDAIASGIRLVRGEAGELYLPMADAELRSLATAVGAASPKTAALRERLATHAGRDVLLVARTAAQARAYEAWLDGNPAHPRITSLGQVADAEPAEVAILTALAPTWARWIYSSGIADQVEVLAYRPPADPFTDFAFGETELVARTVAYAAALRSWLARPAQKQNTWAKLSGTPVAVADADPLPPRPATPRLDQGPVDQGDGVDDGAPPDVPVGLWEGQGWIARLEPAAEDEITGPGYGAAGDVEALQVTFADGRWALLQPTALVTRIDTKAGRPYDGYPASQLVPGDGVVFIDDDSRKDQLAKVLEVADQIPELAVAGAWIGHWRRVVAGFRTRFPTYEALARAMAAEGCTLQSQSIRLWVVGVTIGPDDVEDVRRVGRVFDDLALSQHAAEVHRAMELLRRAHQRLGRRLAALARHVGPRAASGEIPPDEIIDERSGLTAADLEDSIEILVIGSIEPIGSVPHLMTGRLRPTEEALDD